MPTFAVTDRREFLEWLGTGKVPDARPLDDLQQLSNQPIEDKIGLVWPHEPQPVHPDATPVILVAPDTARDFHAWAATYISTYAPFSAFFRVIKTSDLDRLDLLRRIAPDLDGAAAERLVVVAIAEAAVQSASVPNSLSHLSLQACEATFSFLAHKALNSGWHPSLLPELANAWSRARNLTTNGELRLPVEATTKFWLLISAALTGRTYGQEGGWTRDIGQLIRGAQSGQSIPDSPGWSYLQENVPVKDLRQVFLLPKEEQLRVLDRTARTILERNTPLESAEAIVGYLAARLGNGSLNYLGAVDEFVRVLPAAPLWFAFFSMWLPEFDGLSNGQCLGRRLAKAAMRVPSFFEAPTSDISLAEFEVLSSSPTGANFRTQFASVIDLELFPFMNAKFRFSSRGREEGTRDRQGEARLAAVRERLEEALNLLGSPIDMDLFGSSTSSPRRSSKGRRR